MYKVQWFIRFFKWLIPIYAQGGLTAQDVWDKAIKSPDQGNINAFIHSVGHPRTLIMWRLGKQKHSHKQYIGLVLRITQ